MADTAVVVVDNFYPDPMAVRKLALEIPYSDASSEAERTFYRGQLSLPFLPAVQLGMEILSGCLRAVTTWPKPHGEFRIVFAPDPAPDAAARARRTWVHFDSVVTRYSSVVFLNPPEQCTGGTSLYRHRELQIDRLPPPHAPEAAALLQRTGLTWDKLLAKLIKDGYDIADKWEEVGHIGMRFNRCVVFDGSLFHARASGFGTTKETGHLTQNFFFDVVEPPRAYLPVAPVGYPAFIPQSTGHV
jgi:hypothetical protein